MNPGVAALTPPNADGPSLVWPAQGHIGQFYDSEAHIVQQVRSFLASGPPATAIVIATPEHRAMLEEGFDASNLLAVHWLDAEATLDAIAPGGTVDAARFEANVGSLVREACRQGPVRAFGEMVSLLCARGLANEAARLEREWTALCQGLPVALLCGYPLEHFAMAADDASFQEVLAGHTTILPAEGFTTAAPEEQNRLVSDLQRKALLLQTEVARRRRIEAELLRQQEALRAREQELRDFIDNASEGLHQVGPDGRILWANAAELEMLGYTAEEYIGRHLGDIHTDRALFDSIMERLRRGETLRNVRATLRAKDGSLRHVLINTNGRYRDGELVASRCFTRDVSDRVNLEEAQATSRRVLEMVHDGFLQVDRDWRVTFARPWTHDGYDTPPEAMVGKLVWDLAPGLLGSRFETEYRAAMERGERRTFTAYLEAMDVWLESTVVPVTEGIWVYFRDVSERSRVERQLDLRREQQAAVARLGQAALAGKSLAALMEMAVTEVSRGLEVEYCKILELRPSGLLLVAGLGWKDGLVGRAVVPADFGSQAGYTLHQNGPVIVTDLKSDTRFHGPHLLLEHGVVSGMSVIIQGHVRPFGVLGAHTAKSRIFTEDDVHFLEAVANVLAAAIERRRVEDEVRRHRDHLEDLVRERTQRLADSNRELEAFNYSVSHDLRTPLRAIASFSGLLRTRYAPNLDAKAGQLLQQVEQEAVRMGTLIEELLNLARFHQVELAPRPVDVTGMAEEIVASLALGSPARTVDCSIERGITVYADPHLMRALLENLLGNAWKFTRKTLDARIEVAMVPGHAGTFMVRDNGAGFDMAYVGKLFQPFQRLHSPSDFEGTGIGLATVQRIAQRHGGQVWAEGRRGAGATFYVHLPPVGQSNAKRIAMDDWR